jgi:hypothetical protein
MTRAPRPADTSSGEDSALSEGVRRRNQMLARTPEGKIDMGRPFDLHSARLTPREGSFSPKSVETGSFPFQKSFSGQKSFETKTFQAKEFLVPSSSLAKSFDGLKAAPEASPKKGFWEKVFGTKTFDKGRDTAFAAPSFPTQTAKEAGQTFAGREAERARQSYFPGNAPMGGVSTGRQLTADEVREILNRAK